MGCESVRVSTKSSDAQELKRTEESRREHKRAEQFWPTRQSACVGEGAFQSTEYYCLNCCLCFCNNCLLRLMLPLLSNFVKKENFSIFFCYFYSYLFFPLFLLFALQGLRCANVATQRGVRTVRDTDLVQTVHSMESLVRCAFFRKVENVYQNVHVELYLGTHVSSFDHSDCVE